MKYNTVIFDLDGTLLNTLEDLGDSVNFALKSFGYPTRTYEEIRSFVGNGVKDLVTKAVPNGTDEDTILKCLQVFKDHYKTNMRNKTAPYNGIMNLLEELNSRGIKLGIVSNKYDFGVKNLNKYYFKDLIPVAIGEREGIRKKPAPDTVLTAMKELGSQRETSLYVGDSGSDMITAQNAGMKSIGVTWGFRDADSLRESGADFLVDSPEQLLNIIENENCIKSCGSVN
ncbi:HAD family hydrolase [Intestinibacter bartlettii]|uniref:HAD family hydrolase n=1 Tax=Intestinibacter bartlettii TaxID=261299 RepID=A0ABS6E0D9_9FIRM|nr:HAD family hydrolase [Intestinibacter bartlettii]MBU5337568.1 HAD family hydrolase [Intestinibacter bartlettii]